MIEYFTETWVGWLCLGFLIFSFRLGIIERTKLKAENKRRLKEMERIAKLNQYELESGYFFEEAAQ